MSAQSIGVLQLQDLQSNQQQQYHAYLQDETLHKVYVYHSVSDSRGVIGIFYFATMQAKIFVIQPFLEPVKIFAEQILDQVQQQQQQNDEEKLQFAFEEAEIVPNRKEANRLLLQHVRAYAAQGHGPSLLIHQRATRSDTMDMLENTHLQQLDDELPVLHLNLHESECKYPAMRWIPFVLTKMMQRCVQLPLVMDKMLELAKFTQVPLCHLGDADVYVLAWDTLYGRQLQQHQHVLWMNESGKPDLGHVLQQSEDVIFTTSSSNSNSNLEWNKPGVYHSICVELDVAHLTVATILTSHLLDEMQGKPKNATQQQQQLLHVIDEQTQAAAAYHVLKKTVSEMYAAITAHSCADQLLEHMYRWLQSSKSLLHDPILCKLVQQYMSKMWIQLLSSMRKMGAQLVFANTSKIIIETKKYTVEDAQTYVQYLIRTINKQPLFNWIGLTEVAYWDGLVWFDASNYMGMSMVKQQQQQQQQAHSRMVVDDDEDEEEVLRAIVQGEWHMAKSLHSSIQKEYENVIAEYLALLHEHKQKHVQEANAVDEQFVTQSWEPYAKQLITKQYIPKLLTFVEQVPKTLKDASTSATQVTLDWIKLTCHIFSLDPWVCIHFGVHVTCYYRLFTKWTR